jgi:tRNA(Ile2) C34 agmatinyltransferase TiaS
MKKVYGVFPSEYIPDTLSAVCMKCKRLYCYECHQTMYSGGYYKCPKCGSALLSVTDEDIDWAEKKGTF